jgi:Biotin protein ligase C terminal domain
VQSFSAELAPSSVCLAELTADAGAPAREPLTREALTREALTREALLVSVLGEVERRVAACVDTKTAADSAGDSTRSQARLARGLPDLPALLAEFRQHDALRDRRVQVSGARELTGIARGVDDEGRLLLETDGILLPIHSGTVRLLDV